MDARSGVTFSHSPVTLKRATSIKRLTKTLSLKSDDLRALNPALKNVVWKHKALVPKGYEIRLPYRQEGWSSAMSAVYQLPKEVEKPGFVWHRVKKGESACGIAEKYRASCRALIRLNGLNKRATVYAGRRIKVPSSTGGISVNSTAVAASSSGGSLQNYRVKRGESSCQIANRNGMLCREFLALNGLQRSSVIQVGQTVRVSASSSWHKVTRGQTACGIAEKYRVRCSALLDANKLRRGSKIYVGQRLRIPNA